jgi:hypothetical protein
VSEDPRQPAAPVAIRITRPYATDDELLAREPDTITRTGVTLLGAQSRPQGVVLRFELALANGTAILRGEGRVVGYKPNVQDGLGGLALRFTRLDTRSKSLVDKAAALRDQRRQSLPPPSGGSLSHPHLPLPPPAPTSDVSIPSADASAPTLGGFSAPSAPELTNPPSVPPPPSPPSAPPPPSAPRATAAPEPHSTPQPRPAGARPSLEAPQSRDELLGRLRSRARALDPSSVARILQRK